MKLKENLQVVNNQIKIRSDNKNYHRIKYMLEDFERELELGKRLVL